MTNCRKKMPVVPLNLNNFESSIISAGCPYVLTSPRSLRACKKAGIKPVELLYQSTSEIADDLGVHPKYVTDVFVQRETDRQKKLELCRKIRTDIISDETLIKSLDLAHSRDNLTCLSACIKGNRTPTSLKRRHHHSHSSLHHLKGLTEHVNHRSSPSIMSNPSSHSPAFRETSRSPHSSSRHTSPVLRSTSIETTQTNMRYADSRSRLHSETQYLEEESLCKHKHIPLNSLSENNTPSPRTKDSKSQYLPSTSRSKSVPCFPLVPLASVSSTPDYQPHSTDTVSTPRSKVSACPRVALTDSRLSHCTSDLSQSPENVHDRVQLVSEFLSETKCLKKKKMKANKQKSNMVLGTKFKNPETKEVKSKQVAFEENLKKKKIIGSVPRMCKTASCRMTRLKYSNDKEKNCSRIKDGNESSSSRSSAHRKSSGSLSSDKDSKQTEISKPKKKLNEHRKSKYGKSEMGDATEIGIKRDFGQKNSYRETDGRRQEDNTSVSESLMRRKDEPNNSFISSLRMNSMNISSHDLRILESLAMKREQEKANQELAYQAQQRWEADQVAKAKFENELKNKWQKYIQEKRQLEQNINKLKMEEVKMGLHKSQRILEENLRLRDEKVKRSLQEIENRRISDTMMKHEQLENRQTQIHANQYQKHTLDTLKRFNHVERMDSKLEQAEMNRQQLKNGIYKKIASGNRIKHLKHMSRMEELFANEAITRRQRLEECCRREERAWQRYTDQVSSRLRQLKMNSALRELKSDQVRSLARELDQGLERWQDQVMLLQWQAVQRAEASASIQLQTKRLRTECENKERHLQHAERLRRVKALEAEKERGLREFIDAKESRMKALQLKKEREILECRSAAHSTAELREHLRESLTPETFDRKVTKVAVEMRVCNRPSTASPTMMRSHIRLG